MTLPNFPAAPTLSLPSRSAQLFANESIPDHVGFARVKINLINENDNRPVFSRALYNVSLLENTTVGTTVLQVHVSRSTPAPFAESLARMSALWCPSPRVSLGREMLVAGCGLLMGFWTRCLDLSCYLEDVVPATSGIQRESCTAFHLQTLIPVVMVPLVWLFPLPSLEESTSSTKLRSVTSLKGRRMEKEENGSV